MYQTLTSIGIALAATISATACWSAFHLFNRANDQRQNTQATRPLRVLSLTAWLITLVLIAGRWISQPHAWRPIDTHVDGLLLMTAMLGWCSYVFSRRTSLMGLAFCTLPIQAALLAWSLCPANWRPLKTLEPIWLGIHLMGVTLGTATAAMAATSGAMYLFVAHRLKRKTRRPGTSKLMSLETLETVIIRSATAGFILLTLGLLAGVVIISKSPHIFGGPWYSSIKVWVAIAAWLGYALLMNARVNPQLRGPHAAWVAIAGFILLMIIYGVFTNLPSEANQTSNPNTAVDRLDPHNKTIAAPPYLRSSVSPNLWTAPTPMTWEVPK